MAPLNVTVYLDDESKDTAAIINFEHPKIQPEDYIITEEDGKIDPILTNKKNYFQLNNLTGGTVHRFTVQSITGGLRSAKLYATAIRTCQFVYYN